MSIATSAAALSRASDRLLNARKKAGELLAKHRAENPSLPPDLIFVEDAASLLRVTTNCARRWVLAGDLEGWRAGKRIWVSRAAALAMWRLGKLAKPADGEATAGQTDGGHADGGGMCKAGGATTTRKATRVHRRESDAAAAQRRIDKQQERHERATRKLAAAGAG